MATAKTVEYPSAEFVLPISVKVFYARAARVWHEPMNTLSKEAMRATKAKWVILSMMVSTVPQIPPHKSPSARQRVPPKGIFSLR